MPPKNVRLLGRLRTRQTVKLDSEPHSPHTPKHTRSKLMTSYPLTEALWPSKTDAASPPHTKKNIQARTARNLTLLITLHSFFWALSFSPAFSTLPYSKNPTSQTALPRKRPPTRIPIWHPQFLVSIHQNKTGTVYQTTNNLYFPSPSSTPPLQ